MLEHEYRKQQEEVDNQRDWFITSLLGLPALLVWSGIVAVWKYVGHDGYILFSVIVPLSFLGLILSFGALNGSRKIAKETMKAIANLFYYWS